MAWRVSTLYILDCCVLVLARNSPNRSASLPFVGLALDLLGCLGAMAIFTSSASALAWTANAVCVCALQNDLQHRVQKDVASSALVAAAAASHRVRTRAACRIASPHTKPSQDDVGREPQTPELQASPPATAPALRIIILPQPPTTDRTIVVRRRG